MRRIITRIPQCFQTAPRLHTGTIHRFSTASVLRNVAEPDFPWSRELDHLRLHSTLLNQGSARDLIALRDVKPMMEAFEFLRDRDSLDTGIRRTVSQALKRTVRDSSLTMRRMLREEREKAKAQLFYTIKQYCEIVADTIDTSSYDLDSVTCGALMSTYETIDPRAGVRLFERLGRPELAQSAIQCMVKAREPLQRIEDVYTQCPPPDNDRRTATMVWALLRYGEDAKAKVLATTLSSNASDAVLGFMGDAFIGDASVKVAREYFGNWDLPRAPHPSSMKRFLQRAWEAHPIVEDQLNLYARYLDLVRESESEMNFLPVTRTVVDNILTAFPTPTKEAIAAVDSIATIYAEHAPRNSRAIFLNVLLSAATERWPNSSVSPIVKLLLNAYEPEHLTDKATVRVQLNSLEHVDFDDKHQIINDLFSVFGHGKLQNWDWMALLRAANGGSEFSDRWNKAGRPFESDIRRFAKSRHIRIKY